MVGSLEYLPFQNTSTMNNEEYLPLLRIRQYLRGELMTTATASFFVVPGWEPEEEAEEGKEEEEEEDGE